MTESKKNEVLEFAPKFCDRFEVIEHKDFDSWLYSESGKVQKQIAGGGIRHATLSPIVKRLSAIVLTLESGKKPKYNLGQLNRDLQKAKKYLDMTDLYKAEKEGDSKGNVRKNEINYEENGSFDKISPEILEPGVTEAQPPNFDYPPLSIKDIPLEQKPDFDSQTGSTKPYEDAKAGKSSIDDFESEPYEPSFSWLFNNIDGFDPNYESNGLLYRIKSGTFIPHPENSKFRSWIVYFFDLARKGRTNIPEIACARLYLGENRRVYLEDLPDHGHSVFTGFWEKIKGSDVVRIHMRSDQIKPKEWHFFVRFSSDKDQLSFGNYSRYNGRNLLSGSIILSEISKEKEELNINFEPFSIRFDKNPEDFDKVPEFVQKYLSLKDFNYSKVQESINSVKEFEEHLDKFSFLNVNEEEKFFESKNPKLLIVGLDNENKKQSNLAERIERTLTSKYPQLDVIQSDSIDDVSDVKKVHRQMLLARFVILFLKYDSRPFTFVQFGWGLNFSKYNLIFCEEGKLSEDLLVFEELGIEIEHYSDLEVDIDLIVKKTNKFIQRKKLT